MRSRFSPTQLVFFVTLLVFLLALVQVGAITIAFDKLGLSHEAAFLMLFTSLFGSAINLPLFSIVAERPPMDTVSPPLRGLLRHTLQKFTGRTIIAVNVGGCIIPVLVSLYLLDHHSLGAFDTVLVLSGVAGLSYFVSRPIPGVGIGMPVFLAPVAAALLAVLVNPAHSAPLAYVGGTLGVLTGADVLRLHDIRRMGTPVAAIGGAGTFDGIFITGIVAVLLA